MHTVYLHHIYGPLCTDMMHLPIMPVLIHQYQTPPRYSRAKIKLCAQHYDDVIMSAMVSQITEVSMVCPTVCSGADQWKHKSSASVAFVRGIHQWPVNCPHKGPVTRKMFPFDDVTMNTWMFRNYNPLRCQWLHCCRFIFSLVFHWILCCR